MDLPSFSTAFETPALYREIATARKGLAMTWLSEPVCADSEQLDKLKFETLSAVPVELTTQGSIDAEPGW